MIINLASTLIAISTFNAASTISSNDNLGISQISTQLAVSENYNNPQEDQFCVKDLSGNIFVVQTGEDEGTMIIDSVSQYFIESTPTMVCPYSFVNGDDNYYLGPGNYYRRIGDNFYHCLNSEFVINYEKAAEIQISFDNQLLEFRDATSDASYDEYRTNNPTSPTINKRIRIGDKIYIDNYTYIRDARHPYNYDGSCGFVAASIVLNYWDKTVHNGVVDSVFKDDDGELNSTNYYSPTTNLKDKLVSYNNGVTSSWAKNVAESVNKYCTNYGIKGSASWYIGKIGLEASLYKEKPAVLFGYIPNVSSSGYSPHAVTCYGFDTRWWGGYYIVNYGWGNQYAETSLGFGFAGSTMTFSLDEDFYKTDYVINKNIYNFPDSYNSTETTSSLTTLDGLAFKTKRLRCGFIHNEYLTISPRKKGFDTAYIDYMFTNPVRKITINISFWSNDERYQSPNVATLLFQWKNLYSDYWDDNLDLLSLNLSTNRNQQSVLELEFQQKTREFRIFSHFYYTSGKTDRNKGRVSIGDIIVSTYR